MTTLQSTIPYLESGDRLTRVEFERRYSAMPDGFKAELIEGVVYVALPVHFATHSEPHSRMITLLGVYAAATPGVRVGDNATVRLDWENELQPDGLLRLESGASMIDADGYVCGQVSCFVLYFLQRIDDRRRWLCLRTAGVHRRNCRE